MIRFLPVTLLLLGTATAANADITHKLQSSVQLTVNAAATQVERIGSSFSISGNGVATTDGSTANTISAGTITSGVYSPGKLQPKHRVVVHSVSHNHTHKQMQFLNLLLL